MSDLLNKIPKTIIPNDRVETQLRSWEELISYGLELREKKDNIQWELGDIALQVGTVYGEDRLGEFAGQIGINKNTLRRYRVVSKAFPKENRLPFLSFTHHMLMAGHEDRMFWLQRASDNSWSCEKLDIEMKKSKQQIDKNFACVSISLQRGELETVLNWYETYLVERKASDFDNSIANKFKDKLAKLISGLV